MAGNPVTLSQILDETRKLAAKHSTLLIIALVGISAIYCLIDWLEIASNRSGGLASIMFASNLAISIGGQYHVTESLLADRRPDGAKAPVRRYGSLFGALFLSGLAIGAGLIALVLPGIFLAGRWFTTAPCLVENNLSGGEALRASWKESEAAQFTFMAAMLFSLLPTAAYFALLYGMDENLSPRAAVVWILAQNLAVGFATVFGWIIAAATHRCAAPVEERVDEVFS